MNLAKGHIGHCSSDHIYAAVNKVTIVQQRPKSNKDLKIKDLHITWIHGDHLDSIAITFSQIFMEKVTKILLIWNLQL